MESKLNYLLVREVIEDKEAQVLLKVAKDDKENLSLLEAIECKKTLLSKATIADKSGDENKKILLLGLYVIVDRWCTNWGTESGKQYVIM